MRVMLLMLFGWLSWVGSPAWAGDQVLRYELMLDGEHVGYRDVEIRYLPPPVGELDEVRLIRSYLELEVVMGRKAYTLKSRVSAFHGPGGASFVATVEENGEGREIQARAERDGRWAITALEGGLRSTWSFTPKEVGLSSMDLLDPERYRRVLDHESNPMLITENGQVAIGRVVDEGEVRIDVAGQKVTAKKVSWTPEAGQLELYYSDQGLLLDYSLDFLGKRLHAQLQEMPGERSWGGFDPAAIGDVSEEEL